jgi:hypothetical protein
MKIKEQDFNIHEFEGDLRLTLGENYKFSPTSILTYLLKNEKIKIHAKKSWLLTDDYQTEFEYKGYDFVLCTPRDSIDIYPIEKDVPREISSDLYQAIKAYKSVSVGAWLSTWFYVLFLPFSYKP